MSKQSTQDIAVMDVPESEVKDVSTLPNAEVMPPHYNGPAKNQYQQREAWNHSHPNASSTNQPAGFGHMQHSTVVMGQPPTTNVTVIQQAPPSRPTSYLALAVVTTIFCNIVFGVIAIIFSVLSSSAADDGDLETAKTRGKVSLALSLVGIFSTIISVIVIIVYFVVFVTAAVDAACSGYYC